VLSLEMFERDVQEPIEHFLMGHLSEEEFLSETRPWPAYATDYKPLVDLAVLNNWPVVAASPPRSLAAEVARDGLFVLSTRPPGERSWFADDVRCPTDDAYFERFRDAMARHELVGSAVDPEPQSLERYYLAQCVKDETMAESIAQVRRAGGGNRAPALIVHLNGAFHSDFGVGVVQRVRRRLPVARVAVVTILPVTSLDGVAPSEEAGRRADFLLYTTRTP
jgi:uncharacterized iron-regulated protein